MSESFGAQTVTIVCYAPTGDPDASGTRTMTQTLIDIPGCRHEPVSITSMTGGASARAEQQPEIGVTVATQWWKTTAPPTPQDWWVNVKPSDVVRVGGVDYQIIGGVQPKYDMNGAVHHVTVNSERQTIG